MCVFCQILYHSPSTGIHFKQKTVTIKGIEAECLPDPSVKSVYTTISKYGQKIFGIQIDLQDNIL